MPVRTVSVLFLSFLLACGREPSSGAAPAALDSPATAAPDSPATRGDSLTAAAPQPAAGKPRPKPSASKPPASKPPASKPSAPAEVAGSGTGTTVVSPTPDTTVAAAAPAPTSEGNAPLRDQYHPAPKDTVSQQVYDGWKQYNLNCARCHGEDVLGTTIAAHLIVSVRPDGPIHSKELFTKTVCEGRPEKGMPAWCPLGMERPTIEAIYAYVKGRSEGKLHPGRPALREGG
jgi:hypothetical protein